MRCSICGEFIDGHGHNSEPVLPGLCCTRCNGEVVVPARLLYVISTTGVKDGNQ